ncbi:LuxR C-terminal-related transcriptional regulator, partial [Piscinibacter sp.]
AQPCGLHLRAGRLAAASAELQPRLAALAARAADGVAADGAALWLRERGGSRRLRLEVLPCRGAANTLLPPQRLAMLVAQPASASPAELVGALVELCGCTRSEARLAAALGAGQGLREAAGRLGISYESARVYLKAVYRKLDVHDRAQLVGRLARLGDWQA